MEDPNRIELDGREASDDDSTVFAVSVPSTRRRILDKWF